MVKECIVRQAFQLRFEAKDVKKYTQNIIMFVIDKSAFDSVHVCKQTFLCVAIKSCDNLLTLFCKFLTFYKRLEEKGKNKGLKERPWCSG